MTVHDHANTHLQALRALLSEHKVKLENFDELQELDEIGAKTKPDSSQIAHPGKDSKVTTEVVEAVTEPTVSMAQLPEVRSSESNSVINPTKVLDGNSGNPGDEPQDLTKLVGSTQDSDKQQHSKPGDRRTNSVPVSSLGALQDEVAAEAEVKGAIAQNLTNTAIDHNPEEQGVALEAGNLVKFKTTFTALKITKKPTVAPEEIKESSSAGFNSVASEDVSKGDDGVIKESDTNDFDYGLTELFGEIGEDDDYRPAVISTQASDQEIMAQPPEVRSSESNSVINPTKVLDGNSGNPGDEPQDLTKLARSTLDAAYEFALDQVDNTLGLEDHKQEQSKPEGSGNTKESQGFKNEDNQGYVWSEEALSSLIRQVDDSKTIADIIAQVRRQLTLLEALGKQSGESSEAQKQLQAYLNSLTALSGQAGQESTEWSDADVGKADAVELVKSEDIASIVTEVKAQLQSLKTLFFSSEKKLPIGRDPIRNAYRQGWLSLGKLETLEAILGISTGLKTTETEDIDALSAGVVDGLTPKDENKGNEGVIKESDTNDFDYGLTELFGEISEKDFEAKTESNSSKKQQDDYQQLRPLLEDVEIEDKPMAVISTKPSDQEIKDLKAEFVKLLVQSGDSQEDARNKVDAIFGYARNSQKDWNKTLISMLHQDKYERNLTGWMKETGITLDAGLLEQMLQGLNEFTARNKELESKAELESKMIPEAILPRESAEFEAHSSSEERGTSENLSTSMQAQKVEAGKHHRRKSLSDLGQDKTSSNGTDMRTGGLSLSATSSEGTAEAVDVEKSDNSDSESLKSQTSSPHGVRIGFELKTIYPEDRKEAEELMQLLGTGAKLDSYEDKNLTFQPNGGAGPKCTLEKINDKEVDFRVSEGSLIDFIGQLDQMVHALLEQKKDFRPSSIDLRGLTVTTEDELKAINKFIANLKNRNIKIELPEGVKLETENQTTGEKKIPPSLIFNTVAHSNQAQRPEVLDKTAPTL